MERNGAQGKQEMSTETEGRTSERKELRDTQPGRERR